MSRIFFKNLAFSLGFLSFFASAQLQAQTAQKKSFCKMYADLSVSLQDKIFRYSCGMTGANLKHSHQTLYNACLKATKSTTQHRLKTLLRNEKQCKAKMCQNYANMVKLQQQLNKVFTCNLGGPRWTSSPSQQQSWCLKASFYDIDSNRLAQKNQLQQCVKKKQIHCKMYASKVALAKTNQCGIKYSVFNKSSREVYNVCLKTKTLTSTLFLVILKKQTDQCTAKKQVQCKAYLSTIINAQKTNQVHLCGYKGSVWETSNTLKLSYDCLHTNYDYVQKILQNVNSKITACLSKRLH